MNDQNKLIMCILQQKDLKNIINTFVFPWSSFKSTQEKWERYYMEQQANIRIVCIAKIGNEFIGYGSLMNNTEYPAFRKAGIPEINDLWITAEHRGKGFGKKLVQHLEKIALQENHKQIGIGLYKDYGFAQKLYVRMGYIPDGNGVTYKYQPVTPGNSYPVDDDLVLWFKKDL